MVTLCTPTLNNSQGVLDLLESAELGSVVPDQYLVIDNGNVFNFELPKVTVIRPGRNMGVAASWNQFIRITTEQRIISNDDLVLSQDSIEKMLESKADLVGVNSIPGINLFSLFLIRDSVIDAIGYFDEKISPSYGYFEDMDLYYRIKLNGKLTEERVNTVVLHEGSKTFKSFTGNKLEEHHRRFRRAQAYYIAKWGGLPNEEKFIIPFDGKQELIALKDLKDWWRY